MKIGVFSVTLPEYSIEESVKLLKELDYDGIEWRVGNPPPDKKPENYTEGGRYWSFNHSTLDIKKVDQEAAEVKAICDKHQIEVYCLTSYLGPWDLEDMERLMRAARIMDCSKIRVFPPNYDEKENYRQLFDRTVEQVRLVEALARKYDITVCLEIHMGNIIPSASAAYRLASNFDPRYIGIIFDIGNMVFEGFENYRMGIELLGEYISHIHVKNAKWELTGLDENGAEIWKTGWSPYKKGIADIRRFMLLLKEINYKGYVSIEDFSNESDTYTKLKSNLEYLKEILGEDHE